MSYEINTVTLEGTVVGATKVISEADGAPQITTNQIKYTKHIKDKAYSSWFTLKGYGKFAPLLMALREGDHVVVYGVIKQERWESNGKKNSLVVIEPYKILLAESLESGTILNNENDDAKSEETTEELGF